MNCGSSLRQSGQFITWKGGGSFQVVQHHCADMLIGIDGAKFATYQAAWRLTEGLPSTMQVSMAKAWMNQVYQRVCADGAHLHGGIGFTWEHDMQLYLRRAKWASSLADHVRKKNQRRAL